MKGICRKGGHVSQITPRGQSLHKSRCYRLRVPFLPVGRADPLFKKRIGKRLCRPAVNRASSEERSADAGGHDERAASLFSFPAIL
jgi:hypothetical protein